ncbi:ATP-binding cassette A-factor transporter [Saccharomycopsis crataegensis]|uniref:ATP-binding cassette A-factor transporter n=1 Tax=Saccharomycopsis crataegensis TaxID=43959 RepID=A0AAV5QDW0_9ASCO|nr:ATP-binding cassette A-factor transporter [Saccharomycopsis crataegensis]
MMVKEEVSKTRMSLNLPASSNIPDKNPDNEKKVSFNPFIFLKKGQFFMLTFGILLAIFSGLVPVISTIILGKIFDVLSELSMGNFDSMSKYLREAALNTSALLILGAGNLILCWLMFYVWLKLGEHQAAAARRLVLQTYFRKPFSWYDTNSKVTGDLNQINRCIEEFRAGSSEALAFTLQSTTTLVASICVSFYYSYLLTLVILVSFPVILCLTAVFSMMIHKSQIEENAEIAIASDIFDWILSANKLIKHSMTQQVELNKFENSIAKSAKHYNRTNFLSSLQSGALKILVLMIFIQAFWFGSHEVKRGKLESGSVLICLTACLVFSETFSSLTHHFIFLSKASVSARKILEFIDHDHENHDGSCNDPLININGNIIFENVTFAYPSRPDFPVLKNITLDFQPNQFTYVIGKSGSGKSTLGGLLLKLYDIGDNGDIKIDGFSIKSLSKNWLANNITYVQQDSMLFHTTIKENIALGFSDMVTSNDREDFIQFAIDKAVLREMVSQLPEKENTIVNSSGYSLSGGQQQRIALARAIVRNSPILVLDESFSALDKVTRSIALRNIKILRSNRTTIVITHNLDDIEDDDFSYVLEDGSLLEMGKKHQLVQNPQSLFWKTNCDPFDDENQIKDSYAGTEKFNNVNKPLLKFYDDQKHQSQFSLMSTTKSQDDLHLLNLDIGHYDYHRQVRSGKEEMSNDFDDEKLPPNKKKSFFRKTNEINDIEKQDPLDDSDSEIEIQEQPEKVKGIIEILTFMKSTFEGHFILCIGLFVSCINGCLTPLFSYFIAKVVDGIIPHDNVGTESYNIKWSMVVVGVIVADGFTTFGKSATLGYVSEFWISSLRKSICEKLLYQDSSWFDKYSSQHAEITALLLNDTRDLRFLVSEFMSLICSIVVMMFLGLIWAIVVGWKVSLVGMGLGVLFAVLTMLYSGVLQTRENEYKSAVSKVENINYEAISGIKTIRCLNLEQYFLGKFNDEIKIVEEKGDKRAVSTGVGIALGTFLSYAAQMILLYYGLKLVGEGTYSTEQLMTVYSLLIFTIMSMVQSISQLSDISRGQRAGTYVMKLAVLERSLLESPGGKQFNQDKGFNRKFIESKDLSFQYDDESHAVLNGVNFAIDQGEVIGLVGESGSGKSTIAALMARLYPVSDNSLFINGEDIKNIDVGSLRRCMAIVSQKAVFFKGSIKDNLTYGLCEFKDYTDEDLHKYLDMVDMYDFVVSLPNGMDTIVGGQASNSLLSGGQAQRLSISRAMLRKPKILIMDECTSALDPESSRKICDFITNNLVNNNHNGKITTILITHSQEVMDVCTRIITLDQGTIVSK